MTYEEITKEIKKAGYRLTTARKHVISILCNSTEYLGAYDIHHKLEEKNIHVGVTSIYRVLEMLDLFDLLENQEFNNDGKHFRLKHPTGLHAHQLVCSKCGRIQEFANCPLAEMAHSLESESGYKIKQHWLRFIGLCPDCQNPENTP